MQRSEHQWSVKCVERKAGHQMQAWLPHLAVIHLLDFAQIVVDGLHIYVLDPESRKDG